MIPQKAFAYLLLAMVAIGGLSCPCPASAGNEAESHSYHHSQNAPVAEEDVCEHTQCATNCDRVSAGPSQKVAALPCTGKYPVDDIDVIEAETVTFFGPARFAAWTGPPLRPVWLPLETPIRRFDRLLD